MEIKILELKITAFKGIRDLTLNLGGHSANLAGRNGTGKTSVYDAYLWMLFGKDSTGSTKFDVKPQNEDGTPRTGTDTVVEALLLADGKEVLLRRVLHEKWKATPGQAEPVYAGDETLCYIDDVPVPLEKEYKPFIARLIGDEERFKLLSIHGYFMTIPWEQRRRFLVDAAGGNAEAEILARPEFAGIQEILQGKPPEDAKKRLSEQLKRVNTELDAVPGRLDELQRMYNPPTQEELQQAIDQIAVYKAELENVNKQLDGTADLFQEAALLAGKIRRANDAIDKRKYELDRPIRESQQAFRERLENARARKASLGREAERLEKELAGIDADISASQRKREALLANWHSIDSETYVPRQIETICPCCGQTLPADRIQRAAEDAERVYFRDKQRRLDDIAADGKTTAERIEALQGERQGVQESLDKKRVFLAEVEEDIKALEAEDALPKPQHFCYDQDEQYLILMGELSKLREEAERPKDTALRDQLLTRRDQIVDAIADLQTIFVKRDQAYSVKERIDALEKRREELGQQVIGISGQLSTLQEYVTASCTAMESRINAMFHSIQWQLFEPLKNGGYRACCNAKLNGVDYATNLNNGARINAGIEAIRVLSRSMGVTVPLFVDNAEAVNDLSYAPGQMVRLYVSDNRELLMTLED